MAQYSYEDCPNYQKGYSNLASYNQGQVGTTSAPMFGTIVVPSYGGVAYNIKGFNNATNSGGYFKLENAYPKFPNVCSKYVSNLCN